jgi:hypothetical protein
MVALVRTPQALEYEPRFERRLFGRRGVQLQVEARRLDHSVQARRQPRLTLEVRDLSLGGMSGISDYPIEEGEHLSVLFPPRAGLPAWNGFGRVVRCEPSALGFRVAVEFDPLPAA